MNRRPHLTAWDLPTTVELHRQALHLNRIAADALVEVAEAIKIS
ncbi:hypothetical protein QX204_34305 (plasmid) [Nocardia sp. PE-7]|nr:hypothetical protein [Nocardia sp. PE-7]WKG13560.1 hypothetical protein QX204_34305 [Nocardia sp. PE-7]